MGIKFIVEQQAAEEKGDWYVIRVKDRLYRHRGRIGEVLPLEVSEQWPTRSPTAAPSTALDGGRQALLREGLR